jgi:hypothetical protein
MLWLAKLPHPKSLLAAAVVAGWAISGLFFEGSVVAQALPPQTSAPDRLPPRDAGTAAAG